MKSFRWNPGADYLRDTRDRKPFRSFPALTITKLPNNHRRGGRRFFHSGSKTARQNRAYRNKPRQIRFCVKQPAIFSSMTRLLANEWFRGTVSWIVTGDSPCRVLPILQCSYTDGFMNELLQNLIKLQS